MKVNIYIESSIKGLKRKDGKVGFILESDEHKDCTRTVFGTVEQVTEVESYLRAMKYALKRLNKQCEIAIWLDCQHIASAFEQGWIKTWKENSWKNAKGIEVRNKSDWEEIANLLGETVPKFHVNEAHSFKNWLRREIERRNQHV